MQNDRTNAPDPWWAQVRCMRPRDAARYLGVSASKLSKLRMEQNRALGPPFSKVAGVVVYRRTDLDRWLESQMVKGGNLHNSWEFSDG